MKQDWIDIGPIDELPEGQPALRKDEAGHRFACVRKGGEVHALDDRCPHQGYPLSQGSVREGVLTCEWHNWKFDVATGGCSFGGEPVRRFPTRVEGGRVYLNRAINPGAEARRLIAGLREALSRDEMGRALREALRIGQLGIGGPEGEGLGKLSVSFEVLARDGADRAEYGFDHGLAVLADLVSWVERGWVPPEEAFVAAAHAIAEPSLHLGPRAKRVVKGGAQAVLMSMGGFERPEPAKIALALFAERRDEAETRVRELTESNGAIGVRQALLPFVAHHLYDYGHGAIFLAKAGELADRFPSVAEEVLASAAVMLSWATADTSLPPWSATRAGLERADEIVKNAAFAEAGAPLEVREREAYEAEVLSGERQAVEATVRHLGRGVDGRGLLQAIGHAAAVRLGRFDSSWERRLDAEVSVLDVTHAVTFTESAIALLGAVGDPAPVREAARLAVLAAGFVGKIRRADAEARAAEAPRASGHGSLLEAVEARDLERALGLAGGLEAADRQKVYVDIAPFAAFDAAVRPIFYAHTVKTSEALRRLEAADPTADGAYLRALLTYLVPRRPENRVRRNAEVARRFLRDGRPPEGLY